MLYSPRWLFLYPGAALSLAGVLQLALVHLPVPLTPHWPVGIHTQLFASAAMMLGYQAMLFAMAAVLARHYAQLAAPDLREMAVRRIANGPLLPAGGGIATVVGLLLCAGLTLEWGQSGFGALNPEATMRQIIPGVALLLMGTQSLLASAFFAAMRSAFDSSRHLPATSQPRAGWPSAGV